MTELRVAHRKYRPYTDAELAAYRAKWAGVERVTADELLHLLLQAQYANDLVAAARRVLPSFKRTSTSASEKLERAIAAYHGEI